MEQTTLFTIPEQTTCKADDVYILATDADTQFNAKSVRALFDLCEKDRSLGAACGRTIPTGVANPIVWYQKFEYSKDFWLVKASQNIIGSVTCCPGCFSLYRGQALYDIMNTFSEPSMSAFDALVKDHGKYVKLILLWQ
ncbi:chitin synthase chs-2-like [Gigantopelta aegis]|uniref:chitin synthase chs-2-like n=1 Tax=Gigantopelta aegis TaxID=1735272 RepID=UPI001B8888DD|nr:chitin synthase chs-2-like [Gigantopelta aegis]